MGIHQNSPLIDVAEVRKLHALTGDALVTKQANDEALAKIIKGEDKRILLVIGPCSSDNEEAVLDYAHRLAKLQEEVKDKIFIVMRVYTAKPRTNGDGYKGLIHQPDAEGDVDLLAGVKAVRHLQASQSLTRCFIRQIFPSLMICLAITLLEHVLSRTKNTAL